MASYIVLDALICNTDRHHDNWGLLRRIGPTKKTVHSVAPSFDHASSLGRELLDDRRQMMLLDRKSLERYVFRGRGGIFYSQSDAKGENPLQLAFKAARDYPAYFAPVLQRLRRHHENEMCAIVDRIPIPEDWMNAQAKDFCCRMLAITLQKLKEVQP